MDSNERIDEAIELLNSLIEVKRYNIDAFDMVIILRILKAPELPKETSAWIVNDTCNLPKTEHPVETSGYLTQDDDEIDWEHDETGHLCKVQKVFNPEPKILLERAKIYLEYKDCNGARKCINEAIELICGKTPDAKGL